MANLITVGRVVLLFITIVMTVGLKRFRKTLD